MLKALTPAPTPIPRTRMDLRRGGDSGCIQGHKAYILAAHTKNGSMPVKHGPSELSLPEAPPGQPRVYRLTVLPGAMPKACDLLVSHTGLPRNRIKDAMHKGAVWVAGPGSNRRRLRRATALVRPGDTLEFYYDRALLVAVVPEACCLHDFHAYSAWYKPAGLLSQGTRFGDHCSLPWQARRLHPGGREILLVHRLDREVSGVMLLAHRRPAAAALARLFREHGLDKRYRLAVKGNPGSRGSINVALEGKDACTHFLTLSHDPQRDISVVDVWIETGRLHQIRRHFAQIGHPVLGDPRYGRGNKNREGICMCAISLTFICPLTGEPRDIVLPDKALPDILRIPAKF